MLVIFCLLENDKSFCSKSWHIAHRLVSCIPTHTHTSESERLLSDTMEFVPAPAVHRVLCADCGASIASPCRQSCATISCPSQEIRLFPTQQTCASTVLGIRKSVNTLHHSFLNREIQVLTSPRESQSKVCSSSGPSR